MEVNQCCFSWSNTILIVNLGISQLYNNQSATEEKRAKTIPFTVTNYYRFNFIMSILYERASTPSHQMTI